MRRNLWSAIWTSNSLWFFPPLFLFFNLKKWALKKCDVADFWENMWLMKLLVDIRYQLLLPSEAYNSQFHHFYLYLLRILKSWNCRYNPISCNCAQFLHSELAMNTYKALKAIPILVTPVDTRSCNSVWFLRSYSAYVFVSTWFQAGWQKSFLLPGTKAIPLAA